MSRSEAATSNRMSKRTVATNRVRANVLRKESHKMLDDGEEVLVAEEADKENYAHLEQLFLLKLRNSAANRSSTTRKKL